MNTKKCPNCGKTNSYDNRFCADCGYNFSHMQSNELSYSTYCPNCGQLNPEKNQYCTGCGTSLLQKLHKYESPKDDIFERYRDFGFIYNGKKLVWYEGKSAEVDIPEGTTAIADKAFQDNQIVTKVTIPKTVNRIGEAAFKGCKHIKYVSILGGDNMVIETEAFRGLDSLDEFIIGDGVTTIKDRAIHGSMTKLILPNTLKSIGVWAIESNRQMELTIPASVEHMGQYAISLRNSIVYVHQKKRPATWDKKWCLKQYVKIIWD